LRISSRQSGWANHWLPTDIIQAALNLPDPLLAQMLHLVIGLIVFPIGYVFVVCPLAMAVLPGMRWWVLGIAYAVGLWAGARRRLQKDGLIARARNAQMLVAEVKITRVTIDSKTRRCRNHAH
jgi:hypothetical protein